jgi:hypothetical protein
MCEKTGGMVDGAKLAETVTVDEGDFSLSECAVTRDFLLAGFAIVTVANGFGAWQTFMVEKVEGEGQYKGRTTWFVRVFRHGENTDPKCYRYVGILRPDTGYLSFSQASPQGFLASDAGQAWRFLADCLWGRRDLAQEAPATIHHMGYCGACGRPLTNKESLDCGLGPVCRKKAGKAKKAWVEPTAAKAQMATA